MQLKNKRKEYKKMKRIILALVIIITTITAAGCGGNKIQQESSIKTPVGQYPVECDDTLTYWVGYTGLASQGVNNFSELPFFKWLKEDTGINVQYIHPVVGQENEQLNIMLASGEYYDIIERDFYNFQGGPEGAIKNGYIIRLNDVIDKYAPNLKAYLKKHPEIDKMVKTDEGSYYCFPFIRGDKLLNTYQGPVIREDLLKKTGLDVPETVDEWETMLRAFKDMGVKKPFSVAFSNWNKSAIFMGAYNIRKGFFVEDGVVKYGEYEDSYKDFLTRMNKWYNEGLLDSDIASVDQKTIDSKMVSGDIAATVANTMSGLGTYVSPGRQNNPEYNLIPAPYPVLKKGDKCNFSQMTLAYSSFGSPAITTQCKNVELAARLLDYGYSEEGQRMMNFGREGESYNMVDGYPRYAERIMNNQDGLSPSEAKNYFTYPTGSGPYIQDRRVMEQMAITDEQKRSLEIWADTNAEKYLLPPITHTLEETDEITSIQNDIDTYVNEMYYKFMVGVEPLDNFDKYQKQLEALGIKKLLEVKQNAYERYINR